MPLKSWRGSCGAFVGVPELKAQLKALGQGHAPGPAPPQPGARHPPAARAAHGVPREPWHRYTSCTLQYSTIQYSTVQYSTVDESESKVALRTDSALSGVDSQSKQENSWNSWKPKAPVELIQPLYSCPCIAVKPLACALVPGGTPQARRRWRGRCRGCCSAWGWCQRRSWWRCRGRIWWGSLWATRGLRPGQW